MPFLKTLQWRPDVLRTKLQPSRREGSGVCSPGSSLGGHHSLVPEASGSLWLLTLGQNIFPGPSVWLHLQSLAWTSLPQRSPGGLLRGLLVLTHPVCLFLAKFLICDDLFTVYLPRYNRNFPRTKNLSACSMLQSPHLEQGHRDASVG